MVVSVETQRYFSPPLGCILRMYSGDTLWVFDCCVPLFEQTATPTRGPLDRVISYFIYSCFSQHESIRMAPKSRYSGASPSPAAPAAAAGAWSASGATTPLLPLVSPGWPAARRQTRAAAFQALLDFHQRHVAPRIRSSPLSRSSRSGPMQTAPVSRTLSKPSSAASLASRQSRTVPPLVRSARDNRHSRPREGQACGRHGAYYHFPARLGAGAGGAVAPVGDAARRRWQML